jgi:hypothetical protein
MKKWYTSRILWVGILTILIAALMSIVDTLNRGAVTPQDIILLVVGILNTILRVFYTSERLTA